MALIKNQNYVRLFKLFNKKLFKLRCSLKPFHGNLKLSIEEEQIIKLFVPHLALKNWTHSIKPLMSGDLKYSHKNFLVQIL